MSRLSAARLRLPAPRWRRELLYLAYAGMEISWLTPLFLVFNRPAWRFPPYGVALFLGGLMLGYCYWLRATAIFQIDLLRERLLTLLLLPLAILFSWRLFLHADLPLLDLRWIPAAGYDMVMGRGGGYWVIMVTVIYLWWRGLALSQRAFVFQSVALAFRLGLLLLVLGTVVLSILAGFQTPEFIFPFFFFSLTAVALTRLEEVGQIRGDVGRLFDAYWAVLLAGATLLLLGVGLLLLPLARPEGVEAIRNLWAPIGNALLEAFIWLLSILLAPLEPFFQWLASRATGVWQTLIEQGFLQNLPTGLDLEEEQAPLATPYLAPILTIVRVLCGGGLLLGLLALGLWLVERERRRRRELAEQHQSLLAEFNLRDALAGLLRQGLGRLQRAAGLVGRFGVGGDLLAAISVRNLYANATRLARRRGYPRHRALTAYEYLPVLMAAFPEAQEEAQALTDAYVGVHYGELPTTRRELAALRAAYERLRDSPRPPPRGAGGQGES